MSAQSCSLDVAAISGPRGRTSHPAASSSVCAFSPSGHFFVFFFQAEDGIRDLTVTGIQTCALPILPGENGPVAHFMYQCSRGTRVTLYVRTEAANNRETAFRYAKEGNVSVFYWVDRKLGYALSSADISKDDLFKVADAVYQQLNP